MQNRLTTDRNLSDTKRAAQPEMTILFRFRSIAYGIALAAMVVFTVALTTINQPTLQRILLSSAPIPGVEVSERAAETQRILSYFRSGDISLLGGYMLDETAHLAEVGTLMRTARWLRMIAVLATILLGGFIIRQQGLQTLRQISRQALGATAIGLLAVLAVGIAGFSFLFIWFHKFFFVAAPWAFDPGVSKLVNLYPTEYFRNAFAAILLAAAAVCWVLRLVIPKK